MKTRLALVLCAIVLIHAAAKSQVKIGDNATTINSASLLELETTNRGFVLPRVSITNVNSSTPLAAGLLTGTIVYNTNSSTTGGSGLGIYYWDGSKWNFLTNTTFTGNYWSITGNSGTSPSSNFIGTTDAKDFVARTNNVERMRILGVASGSSQVGWIGMGVTLPKSALDVAGNYSGKNVITIQNTSSTGFSSVDMLDNAGNLATTFGFANSGTGTAFSGKAYLNGYGNDFLFTRGSSYDLIMKGSNGYVGLNTSTPSERLHVVGNFYLTGAFMPGGNAGTSGYVLTSAGTNTAPTWNNLNGLSWALTGNSGTNASANFIGTTDVIDFVARTSNIERLRITSAGNVGIGLTNPAYKLAVLSTSNPLYLSGVQATSTLSTDSILTINAGIVKKTPYSSLTGNFWSLTGNSGTNYSTNFLGTTDNVSLRFRTNNTEQMILDSLGTLSVGSYGAPTFNTDNPPKLSVDYDATTSNTIAYLRGSINSYLQMNLRNKSNGAYASSDYVATSDDGTDSTNYIDLGINSSGYAPSVDNFGGPHDGYLYTYSRNLIIGTQKASSDIIFLSGGGQTKYNAVLRMDGATGNLVIGKGENNTNATGNIIRGPNGGNGTNIPGGSLTLQGGASNGSTSGGNLNLYGGGTVTGTMGSVNINANTNSATSINTGTSTGTVTIGNSLNNINLPKLSATSVVLTDGSKNLTSTAPANNTYLYYNGTNFTWTTAATLGSFTATAPLTYNNTTGVFAINQSTTSTDGYLSSADWNIFNNKVGSITLNTPSSIFANPLSFSVSTGTATGTLSLNTQTANTIFAGPASGVAATPTFRTLVASDIPSLAASYIQNQTIQQVSSNFNISGNGTIGTNLNVTGTSTLTGLVTSKAGHTNVGAFTTSGGITSINASSNFATNINTGSSTGTVTIGNTSNNILLPKFNTAGGIIYTTASTGQIAGTGLNMIWDDVNNRLGIGVANPAYKLSVVAASNPLYLSGVQATGSFSSDSVLTINAGIVKKTPYSSLTGAFWSSTGNSGTIAGTNFIGTTDAIDFVAKTNNIERMRILGAVSGSSQAGWIGMGIAVPRSSLDVTGYYTNKNVLTLQNTSSSGYSSVDMLDSAGALKGTFGYANTNTGTFSGKDYFNIYGNDFIFTKGTTYDFYMRGSNGYIGINTNTPSERLHVVGNFYLDGAFMPNGDAGTSGYVLTSAGGGTAPTWNNLNNLSWGLQGNSGTTAGTNFIGTTDAIDFVVKTNNTERLRVTSSGNVGIGTASPQQSLSVNNGATIDQGNSNTGSTANALIFGSNSGEAIGSKRSAGGNQNGLDFYTAFNNRMVITNAGNVGVGITNPSYKLSVLSSSNPLYLSGVQATSSLSSDSILTINAGVVKKTPYSSLQGGASGWSLSGNSGTTPGTNFIGTTDANGLLFRVNSLDAGYLGISGSSYAVAFGVGSSGSSTATQATAIGSSSQATQQYNTALGFNAQAITSSQATAVGTNSLATGFQSQAFGYDAQATTGAQSLAIGTSSRANNQYNIALGYNAQAITSSQTIAIGQSSKATGFQSIAFGSSAQATTSSQTLAIGVSATATGFQSTAIGNSASATGTNSTAIGNGASATTANTLILGNGVNVGIGTTTPSNKLSVLSTSDPLYLSGVQATATFTTDSLLTIYNGVVKKTPYSSLSSASSWFLTGNSGTTAGTNFIGTTDAIDFVAKTNSTERIRITSSGNVGIGTGNPQQSLSVNNGVNIDQGNTNSGSSTNALSFGSSSGEAIGSKRTAGGNQYGLDFYTAYNNRMVITNAGRVGISTTNPLAGLDVNTNFKLGDLGTVNKNVVSFASTLGSTSLSAGSMSSTTFAASSTDVTITISSSANYLTSTQATVTVSPSFDLPAGVSIASARMISTTQLKIRFVNASTTAANISGSLYITINEF